MKIALAQMEVVAADPQRNVDNMLSLIEDAKNQNIDLIAFPEMCVGGYLVGDKWENDSFCLDLMSYNDDLIKASKGIAVAYGNVYLDENIKERVGDNNPHPNEDGRIRRYNAAYVFQNGEPVKKVKENKYIPLGIYTKTLLPNYRIFHDKRHFHSTIATAQDFNANLEDLIQPFVIEANGRKVRVGFELCEDLWCEDYRINGKVLNPTKMLINNGSELIVNLSASPWTYGKNNARDRRVKFLKKESLDDFVPFFYVNCTGMQNNGKNLVIFDGGTTIYDKNANPIMLAKETFKQELVTINTENLEEIKPLLRIEKPRIAQRYEAMAEAVLRIKDIIGIKNHPRFVVGMSGGLDSSVITALLANVLGPKNILGVNIPTRYNSSITIQNAEQTVRKTGVNYGIIPIKEIVELNRKLIDDFDPFGADIKLGVYEMENVQARIRGSNILASLAAKYHALFTNNGNKIEVALQYATLYGDVNGACALNADNTKTEVVQLAKYINEHIYKDEVIPLTLIPDELWNFKRGQVAPGPELKENQVSPIKYGLHCAYVNALTDYKKKSPEEFILWYLNGELTENLGIDSRFIERYELQNPKNFVEDLEWFMNKYDPGVFKRVQAPPILLLSKTGFGYDLHESMIPFKPSRKFKELKSLVLEMKKYVPKNKSVEALVV